MRAIDNFYEDQDEANQSEVSLHQTNPIYNAPEKLLDEIKTLITTANRVEKDR